MNMVKKQTVSLSWHVTMPSVLAAQVNPHFELETHLFETETTQVSSKCKFRDKDGSLDILTRRTNVPLESFQTLWSIQCLIDVIARVWHEKGQKYIRASSNALKI